MRMDNNIQSLQNISFQYDPANVGKTDKVNKSNTFDDIFDAALSAVNETSVYQFQADKAQLDFITGKSDDILAVMMSQEKAYTSLNFTVQVTNKVIEAYREIMRIQL